MAKLIIVVDEDKIGTDRIHYKADAVFRLREDANTFEIEKYRPYAYPDNPYVLKELPVFIKGCTKVKQGYTYVNFPIELTCEIIVTLKPEGQDYWLVKDGYL